MFIFRWFAAMVWWLSGWKINGEVPYHIDKKLYVVIPHTSNWDFPIGLAIKGFKRMEVGYIAKSSLFKPLYGWFFKATGGIPVNRKKSEGFVDSVVRTIKSRKRFSTAIAAEGTRYKVNELKKGFYYIAKGADIHVVYTKWDWQNKTVHFDKPKKVADTYEEELIYVNNYFKGVVGYIPEWSYQYEKEVI